MTPDFLHQPVGRRVALQTLGMASLSIAGQSASAGVRLEGQSQGRPNGRNVLEYFGKVWSSFDGPRVGAFHGLQYLRVEDRKVIPVFGFTGTGVSQAKFDANGELVIKSRETGFFTDIHTGEFLKTWVNPITGERVEVYDFYDDCLIIRLRAELLSPIVTFEPLGASEMMMTWDYLGERANPVSPQAWPSYSTGPVISSSEHFTVYCARDALFDRSVGSVMSRGGFARIAQCWPFMKMGKSGHPDAVLFGRMFTHKGLSGFGEVPRRLLDHVTKVAPAYLEVPPGWGENGKSELSRIDTWTTFANDIPPEVPGFAWKPRRVPPPLIPATGLAARFASTPDRKGAPTTIVAPNGEVMPLRPG